VWRSFRCPVVVGPHSSLPLELKSLHALFALALAAIAQLNMAAALRHHFCLNDDVLIRMRREYRARGHRDLCTAVIGTGNG
jgi:cytochrome b561